MPHLWPGRFVLAVILCTAGLYPTSVRAAGATATPEPSPTATSNPTATTVPSPTPGRGSVQVAPTHGQITQLISLLGQGFSPGLTLAIDLDNPGGTPLATVTTDATGYWSVGITLPVGTSAGTHQILAVDGSGHVQGAVLYTVDPTPPLCGGFSITLPLIGNVCIDIGSLVNDLLNATFGALANLFGNAWNAVTGPFAPALVNTPNFAADSAWVAFQTFVTTLQVLWGTVFVALFIFGLFARYIEAIGAGSFGPILGVLGRATLLTAFLALYNPIMANWVFPAENGLAGDIINANIPGTNGGFDAIGKALATVSNIFSLTSLLDLLILLLAVVISILCVIVRDMGLGVLAGLYIVGPLTLITWLSPQFDFIARWWLRTLINVLLWPVGYALALKVGSALLAASGWTGLLSSLGALGCLLLLYRVPGIISSMAGSDGVAGAITSAMDRAGQIAVTTILRAVKRP